MSKGRRPYFIILGIILIPFFAYKFIGLSEYNKYPAKITGFREVQRRYPGYRGGGGYENVDIPVVEYYKGKDTVSFEAGQLNYFAFYSTGEQLTVLERKDDHYRVKLHTLWYYYLPVYQFLLLFVIFGVVAGIYRFVRSYKTT